MNESGLISPSQALNRINPENIISDNETEKHHIIRHGYSIGQLHFLVKELTRAEIIDDAIIYPLPKCQPGLRGLINVRGSLIPVFDLGLLLSLAGYQAKHTMILGKDDAAIGILIDTLPKQPSIKKQLDQPPPVNNKLLGYSDRYFIDEDNTIWLDFDHEGFFKDQAHN